MIYPNRKRTTPAERQLMIDMYNEGCKWEDISLKTGFSKVTISNVLKEAGVPRDRTTRTHFGRRARV